jgi:hypothetical protein
MMWNDNDFSDGEDSPIAEPKIAHLLQNCTNRDERKALLGKAVSHEISLPRFDIAVLYIFDRHTSEYG